MHKKLKIMYILTQIYIKSQELFHAREEIFLIKFAVFLWFLTKTVAYIAAVFVTFRPMDEKYFVFLRAKVWKNEEKYWIYLDFGGRSSMF